MLCPDCNTYAAEDDIVCRKCGKLLDRQRTEEEELMNFRQGRHLRGNDGNMPQDAPIGISRQGAHGASRSFEDTRPLETAEDTGAFYERGEVLSSTGRMYGLEPEIPLATSSGERPTIMQERSRRSRTKRHLSHRRMVNWAHVLIACMVMCVLAVIGAYLFLTKTPSGQIIMARLGQDATSEALWEVGSEFLDTGDVEKAIDYYLQARAKDEEAEAPNPTGLMQLGSAYEAQGNLPAAEEVYAYVYTEVVPSAPEAYRNQVRVLQGQGRDADAAKLLQLAYQKTGVTSFRSQRLEILPAVPSASVISGYYMEKKNISLLQSQDHRVVYTLDPFAVLPEDGIEYTGPIELGEGEHELRAVAINGDLVSDEMEATYQIYMPTPLQPDVNLAPGTYEKLRKVRIRGGKLSDEDLEKNPGYASTLDDPVAQTLTFYYTIDGSMPDADSPIFDPATSPDIQLPSGRVWIRAVAVNGYGKQGNTLEREFKFNVKPYPKTVYCTEDIVPGITMGVTTREAFHTTYGKGDSMETVWIYGINGDCEKYLYPWGYATFMKIKTGWVICDLYFTSQFSGPRGTALGNTENDVVSKFKDFGQVVSPSGNRGLYEDENDKGKIYMQENGEKIIRYRTGTADGHIWQLDYILGTDGLVKAIQWKFEQ